jgi:hypothetical protein
VFVVCSDVHCCCDQVVAELFARLRSCQAYFFLGCGSAFIEAEADQVCVWVCFETPIGACIVSSAVTWLA